MLRSVLGLLGFLVVCFAAAGVGGLLTETTRTGWYMTIQKPSWRPPDWVFGPVWTTLYAMMAVAAWLVWRKAGFDGARGALGLFALQLALNVAWSGLFFALRSPGAAMVDLVALWVAIALTLRAFWPISPVAGALLIPYLAWVSFAGALNWTIWRMNS